GNPRRGVEARLRPEVPPSGRAHRELVPSRARTDLPLLPTGVIAGDVARGSEAGPRRGVRVPVPVPRGRRHGEAAFARPAGEPNTPDPIAPAVPDDGQDAGVAPAALPPRVHDRPLESSRFRFPTDRSLDETEAPRIFRRAQRGACALARSRPVDVGALMPHTLKDVLPATARLRDDGHLEVGGCDLVSLAAEHGTPMYVFCTETFRRQARRYRAAFPTPDRVYYAAKAF